MKDFMSDLAGAAIFAGAVIVPVALYFGGWL